jgi:hypothetical protein
MSALNKLPCLCSLLLCALWVFGKRDGPHIIVHILVGDLQQLEQVKSVSLPYYIDPLTSTFPSLLPVC